MKEQLASLDIGNQVRSLRNKRDLTGLSKPNLSQIENNLVTPPIATLLKIAAALGGPGHHLQAELIRQSVSPPATPKKTGGPSVPLEG